MCVEYAENRLPVGLHRAHHVFDETPSWQPCTAESHPWPTRVQALCHALPSAPAPQTECTGCSITHSPLHSLSRSPAARGSRRHCRQSALAMAGELELPTVTVLGLRAFPIRAVNARALTVARRTPAPLPSPNPRRRLLPHRHDRGCACGRATSGYLRLNRAVPWMRVVPLVLALPFSSVRRRRRSPAEDGRGHSRLLTWPGGHGPPLVALRPASGVPRRRGPRRPLPRRRQTLAVRHRAFPVILLRLLCKSRQGPRAQIRLSRGAFLQNHRLK